MSKNKFFIIFLTAFFLVSGYCKANSLYQAGTIQALLKGLYQPTITVKEAKLNADTGLGCGVGIGELIAIDGFYFLAESNGDITKLTDSDGIPFLTGSKFEPAIKYKVKNILNLEELEKTVEQHIKSNNIFYMIRVDGFFTKVSARSEDRIENPKDYKPLLEWMKEHQNKFSFDNIKGSLIIVKCPDIVQNIGVVGYHVHFINSSRTAGGHVFDVQIKDASVEIQPLYSMNLILPHTEEFFTTDMKARAKEKEGLKKLETK